MGLIHCGVDTLWDWYIVGLLHIGLDTLRGEYMVVLIHRGCGVGPLVILGIQCRDQILKKDFVIIIVRYIILHWGVDKLFC